MAGSTPASATADSAAALGKARSSVAQLKLRGIALWLAVSLYTGAFIAENVRAGILAVSKGQTEAASALGLRPNRTMSLVILPQALRVIIPPVISQFLNLTKNSSLAAFIVVYFLVFGTGSLYILRLMSRPPKDHAGIDRIGPTRAAGITPVAAKLSVQQSQPGE